MSSDSPTWKIEEFDPRWPQFSNDPYPFYARFRVESPVHYLRLLDCWWLTRYRDIVRVLSGHQFGKVPPVLSENSDVFPEVPERGPIPVNLVWKWRMRELGSPLRGVPASMLFSERPAHTRQRLLVAEALNVETIERLRDFVSQTCERLLDAAQERQSINLVQDYANSLSLSVICRLLGVPPEDGEMLKTLTDKIALGLDGAQPRAVHIAGSDAQVKLNEYFNDVIADHKKQKEGSLIDSLMEARRNGEELTPGELVSTCAVLFGAGHETTAHLIASGIYNLVSHAEQLDLLRGNPSLLPSAVEEVLRFDPPVQRTSRFALEDIEVGGIRIARGQLLVTSMGAANRDPEVFPQPDKLDITRKNNPHVAFGKGIHWCIGAPLARLEAQIAFDLFFQRFRRINLIGRPEQNAGMTVRSLKAVLVSVGN